MAVINGYRIHGKLSGKNAGFCQWGFCEKDGRQYFIKEFLDPVYPMNRSGLSEKTLARKRRICEDFCENKRKFYSALKKCRTGNVVIISDFFRADSKYYITTDKMEADETDLMAISKLSEKKKETLIRAILYSIARLHSMEIVHADIKPNNMLLKKTCDGYYTAKIIDFDAGFLVDSPPEEIQGDFVYLAPEAYLHMCGEEVDLNQKIDIFALGILFHQYWTGKTPAFSSDYHYLFEAVLDDSDVTISERIPTEIRDLISKMLSKNPEERPSAAELLKSMAKEEKISASAKVSGNSDNMMATEGTENGKLKMSTSFSVPKDLG